MENSKSINKLAKFKQQFHSNCHKNNPSQFTKPFNVTKKQSSIAVAFNQNGS